MSTAEQNTYQRKQLQHDIVEELNTANQLIGLISAELQQIKIFTSPGGEFESIIKDNASLVSTLANLQGVNLVNIPPMVRKRINTSRYENQHTSNKEHNTTRNESEMDNSQ